MTGWLAMFVFVALAMAVLWRFGRLPRAGVFGAGAAMAVAILGYAAQGTPGQPASLAASRADMVVPEDGAAIATRHAMFGQFSGSAAWIDFSDTLERIGYTGEAVIAIKTALRTNPRGVDLWVALGNTLVIHGRGMSPAARFAFGRAAMLAPDHPAPPFFLALALARSGDLDEARAIWQELLTHTPADAPWRKDIEARLAMLPPQ